MSKTITRKYIQRITKREGNTSIRQSSGGGGGGGGASQYWVEENYISKLFFNQLFTVYDEDGNVVEPNDTESVIASIKSMFGFWTDAYLSALGNGEGGGAELTLASLADVDVHGVANGQALVYDATTQKWVPGQGGGIDITAMWAALAQSGVQQIDASHLATALTGYATETWVGNQGYITGSALNGYATESWVSSQISDMATQTWVSGNYLSQTNAAATYLTQTNAAATYLTKSDAATTYVSIAFFERLFKAYNGSTVVHPNNTTSTIDNIKAMFGFWTDFYLSALGNGSGGSTPGVTMAQVWSALGNSTTEQINISHLTTALGGYNPTSNFKTINGNSIIGTGDIVVSGGGGDYLPLSGGTMTGQINSVNIKPTTDNISYIGDASHQYLVAYVGYLNSGANKVLAIASNNGDRDIYIDTSHNIGIGHINPTTKLDVNGTFNASGNSSIGGTLDVSAATTLSSGLFVTGTNSSNDDGITITLQDKRFIGLILTNGKSSSETETAELYVDTTTKNSYWYYNSGSTAHSIAHPKKGGTIALTSDLDDYLPLTGGTITSMSASPLIINSTSSGNDSYITFQKNGSLLAWCGYDSNLHAMIQSGKSPFPAIGVKDDGTPYYAANVNTKPITFYTLYHSGNFNPSDYLPLTGGTITSSERIPLTIKSTSTSGTDACYMQLISTAGKIAEFGYWQGTGAYIQNLSSTGTTLVSINDNGNVGISNGPLTPSYKLHVNGTLNATSIYEDGTLLSSIYLPLAGGTMTGTINCKHLVPVAHNTYRLGSNSVGFQVLYTTYVNGIANKPLDLAAADGSGDIYITAAHLVGIATKSPSYQLHVNGTFYASGNSSIGGTFGVTGATTLSSTLGVTGATTLSSTLSVSGNSTLSGYVGVGTAASSSYALKVSGVAYASTGFYSGGYVTALSDARHKDVKGDVGLTVGEVANAPAVRFLWKDRRQEGLQVGSIAQYWQKVMPEAIVKNADGELTMSYGVIALLASIATARKVEDHERRIRELEEENKKLKQQLNAA